MIHKPLVKISCDSCVKSVDVFEIDLNQPRDVMIQQINNDLESHGWYCNGNVIHMCPKCRELADDGL